MSSSQDVRYSAERLDQGRRLATKLWNAARLILSRVDHDTRLDARVRADCVEDRWILSRLATAQTEIGARIEACDFSHAALALYDFVYADLCDWYLEIVKSRLGEAAGHASVQLSALLRYVLTETLTLAHPIIPFVTEEIWSHLPGAEGLLAARKAGAAGERDDEAEQVLSAGMEAVRTLRGWRKIAGVPHRVRLETALLGEAYDASAEMIARLADLSLMPLADRELADISVPLPAGVAHIRTGDVLDPQVLKRRLSAHRSKMEAQIARCEALVAAPGFLENAPDSVVRTELDKLDHLRRRREAFA
jgi:valyl-tRNA synthetase